MLSVLFFLVSRSMFILFSNMTILSFIVPDTPSLKHHMHPGSGSFRLYGWVACTGT